MKLTKLLKCIRTPKEINISVRGSIYNMATTDQVTVERLSIDRVIQDGWTTPAFHRFTVSARVVWKKTKHYKIITYHFFICHKYNENPWKSNSSESWTISTASTPFDFEKVERNQNVAAAKRARLMTKRRKCQSYPRVSRSSQLSLRGKGSCLYNLCIFHT